MSGVTNRTVTDGEDDSRLDRWFKQHYPSLARGRLEKLLRTGQIRVDGGRVKAGHRLRAGQTVRGGSGSPLHVDGALDGLRFGHGERPRLVHRLDKDTSGALVLARDAAAARWLTAAFRGQDAQKLYWAMVIGEPQPRQGQVDLPLAKRPGRAGEKMTVDHESGRRAISRYTVVENLAGKVSFVAMTPVTGRTHQLRVHMAEIGVPVLGDGKYGGQEAFLVGDGVSRKLHLHARRLRLCRPDGEVLDVSAPPLGHFAQSLAFFGFEQAAGDAAFARLFEVGA